MALYEHFDAIPDLVERKIVSRRKHPRLPLWIHNYTPSAQFMPIADWTPAMCDCRGLILNDQGHVVARPFRKFWNYEQVLDRIPAEPFTVWEKVDGSLGIPTNYHGELVVATRGSFDSEQAQWAKDWMRKNRAGWLPHLFETHLVEIVYPGNRIVVDYGDREDLVLLDVIGRDGVRRKHAFDTAPFNRAHQIPEASVDALLEMPDEGREGFVLKWASGFMAKIKFAEYKRLHRLITQCSTRTIWELLRSKQDTSELIERAPKEFETWVRQQIADLGAEQDFLVGWARTTMGNAPRDCDRRTFAEWAKQQEHPKLLFMLLDGKPIDDVCWRMVEPAWATPFRSEGE